MDRELVGEMKMIETKTQLTPALRPFRLTPVRAATYHHLAVWRDSWQLGRNMLGMKQYRKLLVWDWSLCLRCPPVNLKERQRNMTQLRTKQ
jgi:hypothetical protein